MAAEEQSKSLWQHAWATLLSDKMAVAAILIILFYVVLAILSASGVIVSDWSKEVGPSYGPPTLDNWFGLDMFGRSVLAKTIKGTEVAMSVGFIASLLSLVIGVTLGAVAGYFGGRIDEFIVWFYTTFTSIPNIMLLVAITFISGKCLVK